MTKTIAITKKTSAIQLMMIPAVAAPRPAYAPGLLSIMDRALYPRINPGIDMNIPQHMNDKMPRMMDATACPGVGKAPLIDGAP